MSKTTIHILIDFFDFSCQGHMYISRLQNIFTQRLNMTIQRKVGTLCTCFKAFLLCFWEGEMSLLVGTDGDEHWGCGEGGCDCSLEGTTKTHKDTKQMSENTLPEGSLQTLSHRAFVLMKLKPIQRTKKKTLLHCYYIILLKWFKHFNSYTVHHNLTGAWLLHDQLFYIPWPIFNSMH